MLCVLGGLITLGCSGEVLTLGGSDRATSAAESGSPAPAPTPQQLVTTSGGAPAPAWAGASAGAASDGRAAGVAGGIVGAAGASGSQAESQAAAAAGSAGRSRRRGGSAGAAEGGGGVAGVSGLGQSMSPAGTGGVWVGSGEGGAGSTGAAANGCVQNLACQLLAPESRGDAHQDCVDRINQFRKECACLAPLERWVEGEACADEMAKYDSEGTEAHAGFGDKICSGGSAQNECPGWRSEAQVVSVCLQKMWDEGPPPMSDCTGNCFQMYGHFLNMTNQRMTKVACGFHETDEGQVWSVQNFTR